MILLLVLCMNIDSLLADTRGNESVWLEYMDTHTGDTLECCVFLLENIPRLDRLEMTGEVLNDHILSALSCRRGIPDSVFFPGLVWYRTATEPVSPFRVDLERFWNRLEIHDPADVSSWINEHLTVLPPRYLGGMQGPLEVLGTMSGTEGEIRVLQAASLRSLGYPVRTVSGWFSGREGGERSWLEIWEDDRWIPLENCFESMVLAVCKNRGEQLTGSYTETGTLVTLPPDTSAGEYRISINLPVEGRYIPLDWIMPEPGIADTLTLGAAELLVTLSRRLPSGAVEVWNSFETIQPGDTVICNYRDVVLPLL